MSDVRQIKISTKANKDLGLFAMFFGIFGAVPLHYLVYRLMEWEQYWDIADGLGLAIFSCLVGFGFLVFSRKKLYVSDQEIRVSDGFLRRSVVFKWEEKPKIKLRSFQLEKDGRSVAQWAVELLDGTKSYSLDVREGSQMASRTLAEKIAKRIKCPVIEEVDGAGVEIPYEDLDVPFVDRVKKYPVLLGKEHPRPEDTGIDSKESSDELTFSWDFSDTGMWLEVVMTTVVLLLFSLIPLPTGKKSANFSILDLARVDGHYLYFYIVGGLFAVALLVLWGYRLQIVARRDALIVEGKLWGFPIRKVSFPVSELEGVSVRLTGRGALLHLISDARILDERLSDPEDARWVAFKIRRYYAEA